MTTTMTSGNATQFRCHQYIEHLPGSFSHLSPDVFVLDDGTCHSDRGVYLSAALELRKALKAAVKSGKAEHQWSNAAGETFSFARIGRCEVRQDGDHLCAYSLNESGYVISALAGTISPPHRS